MGVCAFWGYVGVGESVCELLCWGLGSYNMGTYTKSSKEYEQIEDIGFGS